MEDKKIIEINGVKLEVDLRNAKKIESYKVGDHVKILVKESFSDTFKSFLGTIIGFDNFENTPTIVIAYLQTDYSSATIKFVYFNSKSNDIELCQLNDWDLPVSKQQVIDRFNAEIETKKEEVRGLEQKREMFNKLFGKYFENEFVGIERTDDIKPF